MEAGIINYAVYENGSEYLGMANVTMPNLSNKKLTVNGAGIPGDIDLPVPGHRDAMTATFNFTDAPKAAYKLCEFRRHLVDIRAAHEEYDATAGKIVVRAYKHIMEIIPTTRNGGTIAPSAAQAASGEYTVLSIKDYIDGRLVGNYDPVHFKDIDSSGRDNLAEVRSALGK